MMARWQGKFHYSEKNFPGVELLGTVPTFFIVLWLVVLHRSSDEEISGRFQCSDGMYQKV